MYQANEFAAVLLMPRRVYREVLQEHMVGNRVRIVEVADWFYVSVKFATNRGMFLGHLARPEHRAG